MSDEKEFGLTNSGDSVVPILVETKDHSKDPLLTEPKKEQLVIKKKKLGRPKKVKAVEAKPEKIWYCSTCRETIADKNVMRLGDGANRCAVFCPQCQRSFGFEDQAMLDTVAKLIKNNPTGK